MFYKKFIIFLLIFLFTPIVIFAHPFLPQYHVNQTEYKGGQFIITTSFSPDPLKVFKFFGEVDTNQNDYLDQDELDKWGKGLMDKFELSVNDKKFTPVFSKSLTTYASKKDFVEDPEKSSYADIISVASVDYDLKDEFYEIQIRDLYVYDGTDYYGFLPILVDGYEIVCTDSFAENPNGDHNYIKYKVARSDVITKYSCESKLGPQSIQNKPVDDNKDIIEAQKFIKSAAENPISIFALILFSFLYGIQHALLPGHAKTVIIAGTSNKKKDKKNYITLTVSTIFSHTLSDALFAFLIILSFEKLKDFFNKDLINNILGVTVALLVIFYGFWFINSFLAKRKHKHQHEHGEEHHHGPGHSHHHNQLKSSNKSLFWIGILSGLTPSPLAITMVVYSYIIGSLVIGVISLVSFAIGFTLIIVLVSFFGEHALNILSRIKRKLNVPIFNKVFSVEYADLILGIIVIIAGLITLLQYIKL